MTVAVEHAKQLTWKRCWIIFSLFHRIVVLKGWYWSVSRCHPLNLRGSILPRGEAKPKEYLRISRCWKTPMFGGNFSECEIGALTMMIITFEFRWIMCCPRVPSLVKLVSKAVYGFGLNSSGSFPLKLNHLQQQMLGRKLNGYARAERSDYLGWCNHPYCVHTFQRPSAKGAP